MMPASAPALACGKSDIDSLTGLRFLAALYVFLFHMQIRWPIVSNPFFKNILEQGAIGMSLFFMLSGFVLALRYADGKTSYPEYLVNRFARIYPTYALLALLTVPWMGVGILHASFFTDFLKYLQAFSLVLGNIFILQAWYPQMFSHWNDGGAWSISVEAFCYILCPFILRKLTQLSTRGVVTVALVCYSLSAFTALVVTSFMNNPLNTIFYSMPIFRLPEFIIGACAFYAFSKGLLRGKAHFLLYAMIIITGGYLGLAGPKLPVYIAHDWILVPVIALSLLALAYGKGWLASVLALRPVVWCGKTSYSFYCYQVLILLLLIDHHDWIVARIPFLANNAVLCLATFAVLTTISGLSYYLFESPMRKKAILLMRKHVLERKHVIESSSVKPRLIHGGLEALEERDSVQQIRSTKPL